MYFIKRPSFERSKQRHQTAAALSGFCKITFTKAKKITKIKLEQHIYSLIFIPAAIKYL